MPVHEQEGLLCQPRFGEFPSLYATPESKESLLATWFPARMRRNAALSMVQGRCSTIFQVLTARFQAPRLVEVRLRLPPDLLRLGPLTEHLPLHPHRGACLAAGRHAGAPAAGLIACYSTHDGPVYGSSYVLFGGH